MVACFTHYWLLVFVWCIHHGSLAFFPLRRLWWRSKLPINAIAKKIRQNSADLDFMTSENKVNQPEKLMTLEGDEINAATDSLLRLAQAHFGSQALLTAVQIELFDVIGNQRLSVASVAEHLLADGMSGLKTEALLRTIRILCSIGVLYQHVEVSSEGDVELLYSLAPMGVLLQTQHPNSMTAFVSLFTENPMWEAWSNLPDFVTGKAAAASPFEQAHNQTLAEFCVQNRELRRHRNGVARFVSSGEIDAVLDGINWEQFSGKTIVDIGGGYGDMMYAMVRRFPSIHGICLDLPDVIQASPKAMEGRIELVAGDMFNSSSIPPCDVIFLKHVFCDWSDEDAVRILKSCADVLPDNGKVILADALIKDGDEAFNARQVQVFIDALLMLIGSRMERSELQLAIVASQAGFRIESVCETSSPSINITVLSRIPMT